jgi:hypothetical protein
MFGCVIIDKFQEISAQGMLRYVIHALATALRVLYVHDDSNYAKCAANMAFSADGKSALSICIGHA